MKRSEINALIKDAQAFMRQHGFYLPPFAHWTPQDWAGKGAEAREIVENQLGWDITDFGLGDFAARGLLLFTLRTGRPENLATGQGKLYAEKIMIANAGQITPLHFHWNKMEDIIVRGGGPLAIQLYTSTSDDGLSDTDVVVSTDGVTRTVKAGGLLRLGLGESISLPPRLYHAFWGEGERALVGEVSLVNDDRADNRFYDPIGRFPTIEEDTEPLHLLCTEYARFYHPG